MIGAVVTGEAELIAKLTELGGTVASRGLTAGLKRSSMLLESRARIHAPKDTNRLADSLKSVKLKKKKGSTRFMVYADPKILAKRKSKKKGLSRSGNRYSGYYAAYQEYGTPTQQAKPFLRPAADEVGSQFPTIMREEIQMGIDRAVKRNAKAAAKAAKL